MKKRPSPSIPKPRHNAWPANGLSRILTRPLWICVLLAVATAIVYWPTVGFDYVNYDDTVFIALNPHVIGGLTWKNVRWAFGTGMDGNWLPLTWLSYMLDADWSGPTATGFHLTNLLLHVANTVMVFLIFRRLTGARRPSTILAGLFALHPLHVESVAWVAERKDVLSTLFFLFTLWAYIDYAQPAAGETSATSNKLPLAEPEKKRRAPRLSSVTGYRSPFYWLALISFALGLMCKPMLVTLPFVLLLLDYWPLGRLKAENGFIHRATLTRLFCEKIPFFMLAAMASALAILMQHQGRAMESFASRPINLRISNALMAYSGYLGKTFWPVDLANPYLLTTHFSLAHVLVAGMVLAGLSALALLAAQKRPYGLAGWLWFLGTLIPVIGLVQVGIRVHGRPLYLHSFAGHFLGGGFGGNRPGPAVAAARRSRWAGRCIGIGSLCRPDKDSTGSLAER